MSTKSRMMPVAISVTLLVPSAVALAAPAVARPVAPVSTAVSTANKTAYTKAKVNVRSGPSTDYGVIRRLEKGTKVSIVSVKSGWSSEKQAKVNWSKLATGGWIRSDLLSAKKPGVPLNDTGVKERLMDNSCFYAGEVVQTTDVLNVRESPSTNSKILGKLPKGDTVNVLTNLCSSGWVSFDFYGTPGWINGHYLKGELWDTSKWPNHRFTVQWDTPLRATPSYSGERIVTLPEGAKIRFGQMDDTHDWVQTEYHGQQGWVYRYDTDDIAG